MKSQLRMLSAAVFVFLMAAASLSGQSIPGGTLVVGMNREISADLTSEVLNNADLSSTRREELLTSALEYNPRNSDALFTLARKRLKEGRITEAEQLLKSSLEDNAWHSLVAIDAVSLYIDTLLRLRKYGELESRYIAEGRWHEYINYPDILIVLADALYRAGDSATAENIVARAESRYPEDLRFKALAITQEDPPLISDYRWLLGRYQVLKSAGADYPYMPYLKRAMLHYLFTMEEGDSRRQLLAAYKSLPGEDPLAELLYLEELPYNQRLDYLKNLQGSYAFNDYLLLSAVRYLNLETIDSSDAFFSFQFENFPLLVLDSDRDGSPEAEFQYRDHMIHWMRLDWNQDNIWEKEILFHQNEKGEAVPYALILREPGRSLQIYYEDYPAVHHAQLKVVDGNTEQQLSYYLSGEDFSLGILDFRGEDYRFDPRSLIPRLLTGGAEPGEVFVYSEPASNIGFYLREIPSIDQLIDEFSPYIYLVESKSVTSGRDGVTEARQSRFENRQLLASRYDLNGDGNYELLHYYEDGQLKYSLRTDDSSVLYLAVYNAQGELESEELIPSDQHSRLPQMLQPALTSSIWKMPE